MNEQFEPLLTTAPLGRMLDAQPQPSSQQTTDLHQLSYEEVLGEFRSANRSLAGYVFARHQPVEDGPTRLDSAGRLGLLELALQEKRFRLRAASYGNELQRREKAEQPAFLQRLLAKLVDRGDSVA